MNLNKAFVLGNLTQDPDRRNLPSGQPVVNFGVATNRFYNNKEGQRQQDTQFHNIVLFGRLAEIASQYLKKGALVLIEGRIQTRNWQDTAGVKHYRTEIVGELLQLGPRTTAESGSFNRPQPAKQQSSPVKEEDIPVIEEPEDDAAEKKTKKTAQKEPADDGEIDVKSIPF